jgi:hypothetical protein
MVRWHCIEDERLSEVGRSCSSDLQVSQPDLTLLINADPKSPKGGTCVDQVDRHYSLLPPTDIITALTSYISPSRGTSHSTLSSDDTLSARMSPVREINLVDIGLISILIYLLIALIRPALRPRTSTPAQRPSTDYQAIPKKHPQCLVYKKFTPRELAKFDGKRKDGEGRLLLAIQRRMKAKDEKEERGWREVRLERTVFDVTSGAGFYGPGKSTSFSLAV